jgi:hypothetical protein
MEYFESAQHWSYAKALYVSWITMTTVGYGDLVPMSRWGRALASADGFMGIVLIGVVVWLVTMSLTRK